MARVPSILCALLILGATSNGKPQYNQNKGNKYTSQDLLDIIANSDDAGPEIKSIFDSGFVKKEVKKPANKVLTESDSKAQSAQSTTTSVVKISTATPSTGLPVLNQNINFASSGYLPGQSAQSWSISGQGYQQRSDFGGSLNYGPGSAVGAGSVSISSGPIVHDSHVRDAQAIGIQGARATEAAARAGQVNAIHNAQALDAARAGNVQRAQEASFEFTRAAEAARRAAVGTAAEVARAQEAERIANAAHFQADRIANAARTNLAMAAARAVGPVQLSNIANSASLAIQAARETEAIARAGQATAIRNAQALDAMRVGNVQRAQAAVWENTRAAESARQAAAGTAAEMARAAEAERVAYAARVRAHAIATLAAAQATVARNAQESALLYAGYGNPH